MQKNDWCYNAGDDIEAAAPQAFRKMRDALNATYAEPLSFCRFVPYVS